MAHIQHPVAGDAVYGREKNPFGLEGQALHGYRLAFFHPNDERAMTFYAPVPDYFLQAARKAGETRGAAELLDALKELERKDS